MSFIIKEFSLAKHFKNMIGGLVYYSGLHKIRLHRKGEAVILMYHEILDREENDAILTFEKGCDKDSFEKQMGYIAEHMNPISMKDLSNYLKDNHLLPPGSVAVTFDDGFESFYNHAYPVLRKYRIPATVFIPSGFIESPSSFWWMAVGDIVKKTKKKEIDLKIFGDQEGMKSFDRMPIEGNGRKSKAIKFLVDHFISSDQKSISSLIERLRRNLDVEGDFLCNPRLLKWSQIKEISEAGVDVGAHTVNHYNLKRIDLTDAKLEIEQSKRTIEEKIQKNIEGFAYPFGYSEHFDAQIRTLVTDAGFSFCCSANAGKVTSQSDVYSLPRISLSNDKNYMNVLRLVK